MFLSLLLSICRRTSLNLSPSLTPLREAKGLWRGVILIPCLVSRRPDKGLSRRKEGLREAGDGVVESAAGRKRGA